MSDTPDAGYTPPDLMLVGDDHVKAYLESDGEVGYEWNGATCLVLTVTGRKTGKDRTYALIFDVDDSGEEPRYVVVASKGGAPEHPVWYLNLEAEPNVHLKVANEEFDAVARVAQGEERERLWKLMVDYYAPYTDYQAATDREIPVVVLDPK